ETACVCSSGVFGDTDTVKSVKEGDSVTLQINVTEIQTDDEIEWKFGTNKILIARINGKTSKIHDGPDGRFRDRLKLDHQTGSLIITNTRTTDSGLYEVEIISSRSEDTHRFNVTVNDRLKLDHQTGSLIITDTRTTDSGLYEVKISRSSSEDKYRFSVTVYGEYSLLYFILQI
uniref:Immunoglobulin domain-containing protein n=1 Tax=Cyprinus carpio TaxID=7962 RepID=A0A8C2FIC6_CYPCA